MLENLKEQVYEANIELVRRGLVIYTWGNVSGISRDAHAVVIKPSGVAYDDMKSADMVVVDLESGETIEGNLRPSSDTPTHLALYRIFPTIGGITHTHSTCAVAFAQAGYPIKALGTTHADYFYGDVPCTRSLSEEEVMAGYEINTGKVIAETIHEQGYDVLDVPGILVCNHGPFSWGLTAADSVYHAVVLEKIAEINALTYAINADANLPNYILKKHFQRKHGQDAYYGQQ